MTQAKELVNRNTYPPLVIYIKIVVVVTQVKELVNRNTYPPLVIYIKECSSGDTGQGISQQEYIPSSCHLY
jgi:hypothetical protein